MLQETLLTRKEAATYLKVKPVTVAGMEQRGLLIPHCRLNGRPRYKIEDLNKLFTYKCPANA